MVGYLLYGVQGFEIIYARILALVTSYTLLAIPLFIFMGSVLEVSGITERMYDASYVFLGRIKGGLAIVTVLVGTIIAATVGVIAASISMLALVALPAMIKRGYDKSLASGTVVAAGCLGILIPPSVMLIIYGPMAMISVGKLFMAAFMPGFLLSGLYMLYVGIKCLVEPEVAPAAISEKVTISFTKKIANLAKSLLPVGILVLAVLGVIFLGIAPPTEAAASGAFVATLIVVAYRRFSWRVLANTALETLRLTSTIFLIGAMSFAFVGIFLSAGCGKVVETVILASPGGSWGAFTIIMLTIFILGFFLDWLGILFIVIPIISPLVPALGFDPLWFAMMICVNFQTAFMTPPFAPGIFFLQGTASPDLGLTTAEIIRGVIPFVILVLVGLALCVAFPEIILWLPGKMIK
jgi:tripartite ATP-independent transporter DctM subunit